MRLTEDDDARIRLVRTVNTCDLFVAWSEQQRKNINEYAYDRPLREVVLELLDVDVGSFGRTHERNLGRL
jgi:hypothetical protein